GYLHINISTFLLAPGGFEATRLEIARRKHDGRFLRLRGRTMKEGKRGSVILVCKRYFGESICRGAGEFAIAVVVEHFLQICASTGNAIEISIAFAQREISVCPP